jgi:hypothetical protein
VIFPQKYLQGLCQHCSVLRFLWFTCFSVDNPLEELRGQDAVGVAGAEDDPVRRLEELESG